jgi:hypothetical protein
MQLVPSCLLQRRSLFNRFDAFPRRCQQSLVCQKLMKNCRVLEVGFVSHGTFVEMLAPSLTSLVCDPSKLLLRFAYCDVD